MEARVQSQLVLALLTLVPLLPLTRAVDDHLGSAYRSWALPCSGPGAHDRGGQQHGAPGLPGGSRVWSGSACGVSGPRVHRQGALEQHANAGQAHRRSPSHTPLARWTWPLLIPQVPPTRWQSATVRQVSPLRRRQR
jgi:hypothetical protein